MSAFFVSLILSFVLCGVARPLLRRLGIIDKPNARSSHTIPTVRGLGVGIVAAVMSGCLIAGLWENPVVQTLLAAGLMLAVVSFIDDMKPVSSRIRFGVHALAAATLLTVLISRHVAGIFPVAMVAVLPVAFLFITGYTNAFNFMDGINGIAGFQGLLTGAGSIAVLLAAGVPASSPVVVAFAVIAGACTGFLPHNFPKARGFMGDVASATLGFWLASCALWASALHGIELLIPLSLLHANFILDTGVTLVRRALRKEKLSQAHREHFYQRLVRSGVSHTKTTGMEVLGVLISAAMMVAYVHADLLGKIAAVAALIFIWTAFFTYAERRFRRAEKESANA